MVVVGAGTAGAAAALALRSEGYRGPVTLVAAEASLPYERPPLSKAVLLATDPAPSPLICGSDTLDAADVRYLQGVAAVGVDSRDRDDAAALHPRLVPRATTG
jgi:3-phenylpropionate/trans-cinnamate dioxygenase ferredoxin reductase component